MLEENLRGFMLSLKVSPGERQGQVLGTSTCFVGQQRRPIVLAPFRELLAYRALIQILVARDLKARYRGSILGLLWTC